MKLRYLVTFFFIVEVLTYNSAHSREIDISGTLETNSFVTLEVKQLLFLYDKTSGNYKLTKIDLDITSEDFTVGGYVKQSGPLRETINANIDPKLFSFTVQVKTQNLTRFLPPAVNTQITLNISMEANYEISIDNDRYPIRTPPNRPLAPIQFSFLDPTQFQKSLQKASSPSPLATRGQVPENEIQVKVEVKHKQFEQFYSSFSKALADILITALAKKQNLKINKAIFSADLSNPNNSPTVPLTIKSNYIEIGPFNIVYFCYTTGIENPFEQPNPIFSHP